MWASGYKVMDYNIQKVVAIPTCWGSTKKIIIGKNVKLLNTLFNTISGVITIEDDVFFGHNVCVITGAHDVSRRGMDRQQASLHNRNIFIGRGVWIASNVTVMGPCRIGEHSVIAAGSAVRGDVRACSLYAGVPAVFIKEI